MLHSNFVASEYYPDVASALPDSFLRTDADFLEHASTSANRKLTSMGAAAVSMVVTASHLTIANAGDCRALLIRRNGTFTDLSVDHTAELQDDNWTPHRPDEGRRVRHAGGAMAHGYVEVGDDRLPMTRAVGDLRLKTARRGCPPQHSWQHTRINEQVVTALPEVLSHARGNDDLAVVLASDGVFGSIMTSEQVADRTRRMLMQHQGSGEAESKTARMLADCALNEYHGSDNIGIVVVAFEPPQLRLEHQTSQDSMSSSTPTEACPPQMERALTEKLSMPFRQGYPPRPLGVGKENTGEEHPSGALGPSAYLPADLC